MSRRRRPLSRSSWQATKLRWTPIYRAGARKAAESAALSPEFRLWLLAVERYGPSGHSVFEPGELIERLARVNRTTGEVTHYSDRTLRRVIAKLVEAGALGEPSNTRCLVLPIEMVDAPGVTSRVNCPEHGHRYGWSRGGWVRFDPQGHVVEAA